MCVCMFVDFQTGLCTTAIHGRLNFSIYSFVVICGSSLGGGGLENDSLQYVFFGVAQYTSGGGLRGLYAITTRDYWRMFTFVLSIHVQQKHGDQWDKSPVQVALQVHH